MTAKIATIVSTQRFEAERMRAKIRSYPVDHTPMYTQPNLVADVITEAAGEKALSRSF